MKIESAPGKIILVVGTNGHGKTAWVVDQIVRGNLGPVVYTNIRPVRGAVENFFPSAPEWHYCDDPADAESGPLALVPTLDPSTGEEVKVTRVRDAAVIVDEASCYWTNSKLDKDWTYIIAQKRKLGLTLVLICPRGNRIPAAIREVVDFYYVVEYLAATPLRMIPGVLSIPMPAIRMIYKRVGYHKGDPEEAGRWNVNRRALSCYDTMHSTRGDVATDDPREFESNRREQRSSRFRWLRFLAVAAFMLTISFRVLGALFTKGPPVRTPTPAAPPAINSPVTAAVVSVSSAVELPDQSQCLGDVWRTPDGVYWRDGSVYPTLLAATMAPRPGVKP